MLHGMHHWQQPLPPLLTLHKPEILLMTLRRMIYEEIFMEIVADLPNLPHLKTTAKIPTILRIHTFLLPKLQMHPGNHLGPTRNSNSLRLRSRLLLTENKSTNSSNSLSAVSKEKISLIYKATRTLRLSGKMHQLWFRLYVASRYYFLIICTCVYFNI
jgi:hypothetical protein